MDIDYVTLDVFTTQVFGGNPLAVVPDARGLSAEQMQAITAEFRYSEATFVLPPDSPDATGRVRIFTPVHEIPFAGHPIVGTAVALARAGMVLGQPVGDRLRFEEGVGLVDVDILRDGAVPVGARFTAPEGTALGPMFEAAAIAEAVGLPESAIRSERHLPQLAELGVRFVFAEVRDIEALEQCTPAIAPFRKHLPHDYIEGLYVYCRSGEAPDFRVRARLFAPGAAGFEDAATGSAAAILAALMHRLDDNSGDFTITIDQGIEMGRPSRIAVDVTRGENGPNAVRVSGNAVPVMRGTLTI